MIYGIGTDIVDVKRIEILISRGEDYVNRVFTKGEISYCSLKKNKFENFAARFAAKEAYFKSLGTGWIGEMEFFEIEVINDAFGKPYLKLHGKVREYTDSLNIKNTFISLSHTQSQALAMVVLEI